MDKFLKQPPRISDAITSIRPKAEWVLRGSELEWVDEVQVKPTQSEIDTELARLQIEYDAQEYIRNRKREYPTIEELVVALYDTDDKAAIEAKRAEVKAKYPKWVILVLVALLRANAHTLIVVMLNVQLVTRHLVNVMMNVNLVELKCSTGLTNL